MSSISSPSNRTEVLARMHEAVIAKLPLLGILQFSDGPDSQTTYLPNFIGLIAAILESAERPCCIVLPDCKGVSIAVSALVAISRLREDFPTILREHADASFRERVDHVIVHPCGLIYRYDGFFNEKLFRLKVLDRNESRSLPVTEIARLEKTTRKRPKGYLTSDLDQAQVTILGSLLGIKASVNRNLLRNRVVLLASRGPFIEESGTWSIQATVFDKVVRRPLADEIPIGKVNDSGQLLYLDGTESVGEPLIAIASRAEDLAAHCCASKKFQKRVLVTDVDRLMRDFRAYDSIIENQQTIILASESQRESVRLLSDRGCEVWRFSANEVLSGLPAEGQDSPFRALVKKASNAQRLVISTLRCGDENLERAAIELNEATKSGPASDNSSVLELNQSLYRVLTFCADFIGQGSERFSLVGEKFLRLAKENLQTAQVWLTPDSRNRIGRAIDGLQLVIRSFVEPSSTGKGQVLVGNLRSNISNRVAVVVTRRDADHQQLRNWLASSGVKAEVYALSDFPQDASFDHIVVTSWPGWKKFDRIVYQYATDRLTLLAYGFEEEWLNAYRQRCIRLALTGISNERKAQLLGISITESADSANGSQVAESTAAVLSFDLTAERFLTRHKHVAGGQPDSNVEDHEEVVDATYVDFVGATFAYLTEGHKLPVLNAYIFGQSSPGKISLQAIASLKPDDYVMFRESGDSDIIRFLAEDEIGKEVYQRHRVMATRWRTALVKLGRDSRQIWETLRTFGFSRHLQTVRGWLSDDGTICPQDMRDVRIIAGASHDNELFKLVPEVELARDEIMRLHVQAGFRLTELLLKELPKKMSVLAQGETELDLGVGKVWVVRIEDIDLSVSSHRRSQVNRLLWDAGAV